MNVQVFLWQIIVLQQINISEMLLKDGLNTHKK
jgi:hypothetical protein